MKNAIIVMLLLIVCTGAYAKSSNFNFDFWQNSNLYTTEKSLYNLYFENNYNRENSFSHNLSYNILTQIGFSSELITYDRISKEQAEKIISGRKMNPDKYKHGGFKTSTMFFIY